MREGRSVGAHPGSTTAWRGAMGSTPVRFLPSVAMLVAVKGALGRRDGETRDELGRGLG